MRYLLFVYLVCICNSLPAQNGKLLSKTVVNIEAGTFKKVNAYCPNAKEKIALVNVYKIDYLSDSLKIKGYLIIPKRPGKYPCIIYNRGGNRDDGMIDDSGLIVRGLIDLSAAGYVVAASQYRGNDGGEGREEFGGKDVQDVLNLFPLLSQFPKADTSRIGMFGWSRGGMMTYISLTKTLKLKAAVVGGGLSDLQQWIKDREDIETNVLAPLIPDYATKKEQALQQRSAIAFAGEIARTTPLLILHGSADWRVPASQALTLVQKFYTIKQPVRFILYEGGQHSLLEYRKEYIAELIEFFNRYVRDKKIWPSINYHGE